MSRCDPEFYDRADALLEPLRRRPLTRLWRIPNLAGRKMIDALKHRV